MKNKLLLLCVMLIVSYASLAQNDSLRMNPAPPVPGERNNPGKELKEDRVEIRPEEIPAKMKDVLMNDEKYTGWEKGNVYYEKNSDQYLLHIVRENTTKTFRFDKTGTPVLTEAGLETEEDKQ